jgi:WD40 repeat protein
VLKGIRGAVTKLAFSPDDRYLAAFGENLVLMIWDASNG